LTSLIGSIGSSITVSGGASGNIDLTTDGATSTLTMTSPNISVTGATTIKNGNEMRFEESGGSNYSSFKAGAQTADLEYTLPTSAPTATNNVLKATTTTNPLTLAWSNPNSAVVYGVNTPIQINNASENDYPVPADATVIRLNSIGDVDITGFDATGVADGRVIVLVNVSGAGIDITLKDLGAGSAVGNRLDIAGGDVTIVPKGSATLVYDASSIVWRLISKY
jgi:hypothetical protein